MEIILLPQVLGALITGIVSIIIVFINIVTQFRMTKSNRMLAKEMETLKDESSKNFLMFSLYQNKNFDKQLELWENLIDLEEFVDELWGRNFPPNRNKAKSYSKKAKINLKKSRIFLEEELFREIERIINILDRYLFGKESLEESYYKYTDESSDIQIQRHIDINSVLRKEYKESLEKLVKYLRLQK